MSKIADWFQLSQQLKSVKEKEAALRRELVEEIIAGRELVNGRLTVKETVDGFQCKAVQELSYNLDESVLGTVWNNLSQAEKAVIKLKPTLIVGAYKKLPSGLLIHEAVTTKLAMPTLEATMPLED